MRSHNRQKEMILSFQIISDVVNVMWQIRLCQTMEFASPDMPRTVFRIVHQYYFWNYRKLVNERVNEKHVMITFIIIPLTESSYHKQSWC